MSLGNQLKPTGRGWLVSWYSPLEATCYFVFVFYFKTHSFNPPPPDKLILGKGCYDFSTEIINRVGILIRSS